MKHRDMVTGQLSELTTDVEEIEMSELETNTEECDTDTGEEEE